jgi:phage tail-like protein
MASDLAALNAQDAEIEQNETVGAGALNALNSAQSDIEEGIGDGDDLRNADGGFDTVVEGADTLAAGKLSDLQRVIEVGDTFSVRNLGSWMKLASNFAKPDVNYNFIVLIGGAPLGEFQSCENIVINHQPYQWKEGGRNHSPHYLPLAEPMNRGELSLKWGNVIYNNLYSWIKGVEVGKLIRKEVFVVQMGRHGWPNIFYRFAGCMPIYWEGAALNATSSSWAVEELKLVYEHTTEVRTLVPTALTEAGVI